MVAKFAIFSCLVAAAAAIAVPVHQPLAYAAPVAKIAYAHAPAPLTYAAPVAKVAYAAPVAKVAYAAPVAKYYAEPEAPAHYEFAYSVEDSHTGDVKQQQESRAGDAVQGSYSLIQPDGVRRVVHYSADKEHGFNAQVAYEGHPVEQKVAYAAPVAKVAYAAPVAKVAYAAPVAKVAYAAPAQHYAAPVQHYAAPIQHYAAPVQHYAAPVQHYAAPVQHYAAPVAKVAYAAPVAKLAYTAPLGHVSFSSPAVAYHH